MKVVFLISPSSKFAEAVLKLIDIINVSRRFEELIEVNSPQKPLLQSENGTIFFINPAHFALTKLYEGATLNWLVKGGELTLKYRDAHWVLGYEGERNGLNGRKSDRKRVLRNFRDLMRDYGDQAVIYETSQPEWAWHEGSRHKFIQELQRQAAERRAARAHA